MSAAKYRCFTLVISLIFAGLTACSKGQNQAAYLANGSPTDGNLAPVNQPNSNYYEPVTSSYEQPVETAEPPPPLPDYNQPPCPGQNYIWTPGYWGYATAGYYWVPGAWVLAPWVGALWTPPWWSYENGVYFWHTGYWGPHIGFYGGIDYGFGYTGRGYYGAYWNHGAVAYNVAVTNVNASRVHNVYDYPVRQNRNRISFNGGPGGVDVRPTAQELAASRDPRTPAVAAQIQHAREASANRAQFAMTRNGRPEALVSPRPLATHYGAPAAHPPASAMRVAPRAAPETVTRVQANQRPVEQAARPLPAARQPEAVQRPPAREQVVVNRPAPAARPSAAPEFRPEQPVARAMPEARPQPAFRREQPVARAMPEARPQPRIAAPPRPAPQARPAPPRPEPQARPEPQRPERQPHP